MRIVVHFDKRTEHAPCLFDFELNTSPKDDPVIVDYGRAFMEKFKSSMANIDGFELARRKLRGVPAFSMRYNRAAGRFDPPCGDNLENAPRIRVALANFMRGFETALGSGAPAQADADPSACVSCAHFCQRPGRWRSVRFFSRFKLHAKLLPYCRRRDAFLSYADYSAGCADREEASK